MSSTTEKSREQRDTLFMELALKQAEIAITMGQTPFGAIVVDQGGSLIGEGHNRVRSDHDPAAHGEIVAIREAWRRLGSWQLLKGCTLYTSCEPCLLCSFVITQTGICRVVFAAHGIDVPGYKPLLGADMTAVANWVNLQTDWSPLEIVGGFMRERALETISTFPWAQAEAREIMKNQP